MFFLLILVTIYNIFHTEKSRINRLLSRFYLQKNRDHIHKYMYLYINVSFIHSQLVNVKMNENLIKRTQKIYYKIGMSSKKLGLKFNKKNPFNENILVITCDVF